MNNQLFVRIPDDTFAKAFDITIEQLKFYCEIVSQCKRIGDGSLWKIPSIRIMRIYPENPYKGLRENKIIAEWIYNNLDAINVLVRALVTTD